MFPSAAALEHVLVSILNISRVSVSTNIRTGKKWAQLEIRIILTLIIWHFELQPTPAAVSSHRAVDGVTHKPVQTYVRLKEIAI